MQYIPFTPSIWLATYLFLHGGQCREVKPLHPSRSVLFRDVGFGVFISLDVLELSIFNLQLQGFRLGLFVG